MYRSFISSSLIIEVLAVVEVGTRVLMLLLQLTAAECDAYGLSRRSPCPRAHPSVSHRRIQSGPSLRHLSCSGWYLLPHIVHHCMVTRRYDFIADSMVSHCSGCGTLPSLDPTPPSCSLSLSTSLISIPASSRSISSNRLSNPSFHRSVYGQHPSIAPAFGSISKHCTPVQITIIHTLCSSSFNNSLSLESPFPPLQPGDATLLINNPLLVSPGFPLL